ncbi:MAG: phosphonate C-P lyase system protein PhnH [Burkholderiales bacterium]|nr:phosphonate C-P lyase system protein PhnH [Burkholderiales bacterium]
MPPAPQPLPQGFAHPATEAQATFRALLQAVSMPGQPVACPVQAPVVPGLMPATAAVLLALTDHETPVWWAAPQPAAWLRFHTGAPVVADAAAAAFAVCALGQGLPALTAFAAGTDLSPERSGTLLIELPAFTGGPALCATGPGLRVPRTLALPGLPPDFCAQWQHNHARFPSGVDLVLLCGNQLMGLPRSTALAQEGAG